MSHKKQFAKPETRWVVTYAVDRFNAYRLFSLPDWLPAGSIYGRSLLRALPFHLRWRSLCCSVSIHRSKAAAATSLKINLARQFDMPSVA